MKPKDVRVLRVNCGHSEGGRWRVHLLEEEWKALSESYDRIFQDRYDLLTVHTKEGMLASEWLMRTATAERERDEERAEAERWRNAHHEASIRLQAHDCGEEAAKLYERAGRAEEAVQKLGAQLEQAERELDEALRLAYMGEHYFEDLSWKAQHGLLFEDLAKMREALRAAEKRELEALAELDEARDLLRAVAAACRGLGPRTDAVMSVVGNALAQLDSARAEVERLRWGNDMACENTPTAGCECPGCETARLRAEKGETGP